jgi:four helix bundle protein
VPGNISEGFGRKHIKDKLNFYYDSRGSLAETKNHLIYGHHTGYFTKTEFEENSKQIEEVWKELNSLINSLYKKI